MTETAMMQLLRYILVDCRNENGAIQFHAHETFNKFLEMEKEQIIKAQAKEDTYTEEQVREAIRMAQLTFNHSALIYSTDEIIQSLKQSK